MSRRVDETTFVDVFSTPARYLRLVTIQEGGRRNRMAHKEFIFQGFTPRSHKDSILELFDVDNIQSVFLSVAFVSANGVRHILDRLTANGAKLVVFAGIRNDITSHQALVALQSIGGSTVYAVDTGSRHLLFHPKIYLVRGDKEARVMIGSANLTLGGLSNNIEAGMLIKLNMTQGDDKALVDEIENQLLSLPANFPPHIIHLDTTTAIDGLLATGRIADETVKPPPRSSTTSGATATDPVTKIVLRSPILRPLLKPASPAVSPPSVPVTVTTPALGPALTPQIGIAMELVWQSKPLTERDLNIPKGTSTNKTGSVNLDKGLLPTEEDHRPYFRNKVFNALNWTYRSPSVDEAYAWFQFILKGMSYGDFNLAIRHSHDETSKSWLQNNAMTRVSWGPLKTWVSDPSLLGRTLALYRDKADPTKFVLEID